MREKLLILSNRNILHEDNSKVAKFPLEYTLRNMQMQEIERIHAGRLFSTKCGLSYASAAL